MKPKIKHRKDIEEERCNEINRLCITPKNDNSEELFLCPILCGTNPKPECYGDYPNCILYYRGIN